MEIEKKLIEFLLATEYDDIPPVPIDVVKKIVLTIAGSIIAGAGVEECPALVQLVKETGGKQEAAILVYGGKVPAPRAALTNGTMARVLDYEDAIIPGLHMGPVAVPAALAAAELAGGCSGREFLTSLITGIELANRINQINVKAFYGPFKGTGVCAPFAATAAAGRILGLSSDQMFNALGLTLNRTSGSGQSNIDGAQAVSLVAGFSAESGVICSQLAQRGITGPKNFLEGTYGWFNTYGRDRLNTEAVTGDLGKRFELNNTLFKKYPSCGLTQTSTEGILQLVAEEGITPDNVERIDITVGPFAHTNVGHFKIGDSPRVNAQFSIPYCVANALLRKSSRLQHFEESLIRDPRIAEIAQKITVSPDPAIEARDQRAMEMDVKTRNGAWYHKRIDIPRGSPGNEMTYEEQIARYKDCVSYGSRPIPPGNAEKIPSLVEKLEEMADIRDLIPLMISQSSA